jgi:hypothetical protein
MQRLKAADLLVPFMRYSNPQPFLYLPIQGGAKVLCTETFVRLFGSDAKDKADSLHSIDYYATNKEKHEKVD